MEYAFFKGASNIQAVVVNTMGIEVLRVYCMLQNGQRLGLACVRHN